MPKPAAKPAAKPPAKADAPHDTTDRSRTVVWAPSPTASPIAMMAGRPGGKIVSGWSASITQPRDAATLMPVER